MELAFSSLLAPSPNSKLNGNILAGVWTGTWDWGAEGGLWEETHGALFQTRVDRDWDEERRGEGGGEEQQREGSVGGAGQVEGGDGCQICRCLHKGLQFCLFYVFFCNWPTFANRLSHCRKIWKTPMRQVGQNSERWTVFWEMLRATKKEMAFPDGNLKTLHLSYL